MKTLQVGKSYKSKNGDWYFIRESADLEYPFLGSKEDGEEWYYTPSGLFMKGLQHELDLIIPEETEQTTVLTKEEPKVKHLEVILAIVQKIPVQYDYMQTGTWHDYSYTSDDLSPVNYPEYNWRIKPLPEPKRTVVIGKRTVIAPEVEAPAIGTGYFSNYDPKYLFEWENDLVDKGHLAKGCVYLNSQDAINCQEAISALLLGKD